MTSGAKDEEFIREGLKCYPTAWAAVDHFQTQIDKAIRRAVEERDWRVFRPRRTRHRPDIGKLNRTGTSLTVYHSGRRPIANGGEAECWLNLGVWWDQPLQSGQVLAVCQLGQGRGTIPIRLTPSRHPDVRVGPLWRQSQQFLLLTIGQDFDLDEGFGALLDAFEQGLEEMSGEVPAPTAG